MTAIRAYEMDLYRRLADGLEALPEMLQAAPGIKVVIFTIDNAEELRRQAFRLGAHGYVVKSGPPHDLLAEVNRLLAEKV